MNSVAEVTSMDWCTRDYRLSDAGAAEIESSVEHVSSATRAANSVKKQSTFPVKRIHPEGSLKESVVEKSTAQSKKAETSSLEVNSSGNRAEKWKSMLSLKTQKDQSNIVNKADEEYTIKTEHHFQQKTRTRFRRMIAMTKMSRCSMVCCSRNRASHII